MNKTKHNKRTNCLVCGSTSLSVVANLGNHPNADTFTLKTEILTRIPLQMESCNECGHCQLSYIVSKESRYTEIEYSYTSANSAISRDHFNELSEYISFQITNKDKIRHIIEPGSNDGYLLNCLSTKFKKAKLTGIDPCNISERIAGGSSSAQRVNRVKEFFEFNKISEFEGSADIIVGTNVLNHADNPKDFLNTCRRMIKKDGYLIIEVPDVCSLSQNLYFETIYHEHVSYFSPYSLILLAANYGFELVKLMKISYMCGSLRATFRKSDSSCISSSFSNIWHIRRDFDEKCKSFKSKLNNSIRNELSNGKCVIGLGASTKANTLLNFCDLSQSSIKYLTDVSVNKIGKFSPGSAIKVIHPKDIHQLVKDKDIVGIPITVNISKLLRKEAECYNFQYLQLPSRL